MSVITAEWPTVTSAEMPDRPPIVGEPPATNRVRPDRRAPAVAARRLASLVTALTALVVTSWLAGVLVATPDGSGFGQPLDDAVAGWMTSFRPAPVVRGAELISAAVGALGLIGLAVIIGAWSWRRSRRAAFALLPLAAVVASGAVVQAVKMMVDRPRPGAPFAAVLDAGASFPSFHAAGTAALALVVTALMWRLSPASHRRRVLTAAGAVVVVLAVSTSRIVLGVHWLSDVGAGLVVGVVVGLAMLRLVRPVRDRARTRRRRCRVAGGAVAAALVLLPAGYSYAGALRAPGYATLDTRSVDWLRNHGLSPAVDRAESWWLWRHLPSATAGIDSLPAAPLTASAGRPASTGAPARSAALPRPVVPLVTPALPGEGTWTVAAQAADGSPAIATTTIRPDPSHPSVTTSFAWMNSTAVRFTLVAGTSQPGGGPGPWGAQVPQDVQAQLLAAFNSGYKMADTPGGALIEGHRTGTLEPGLASLVVHRDGTATVGEWGRDVSMTPDVVAVRQNLSLVLANGQPVAGLAFNSGGRWGTVRNTLPTWRSGLGVDARGNLIYVGGDQLTLSALGSALQQAGAVTAMELDIHTHMVTYNLFTQPATGGSPVGHKLSPDMTEKADRYLHPDQRDFIAVLAR